MALIQYAAPRDRQPQEAVGVDWDNPIAKDLAVAVNPGTGIDHVTGRPLTPSGTYTKGIGDKGLTFKGPDTQVAGNWSVPVNIPEHWDCTILVIGLSNADYVFGGGSYPHFSINSAETSGLFFSGQTLQAQITNNNFTQVDGQTAGKTYTYAAVKRDFNQGDHYIDGVYRNTTTIGYRTISAATTAYVGRASGVNIEKAQSFLCLYFTRALSAAEIKSVSDNPWQLFVPQTIPVPVSAGGGGTTISATPGNAVADGTTASVKRTIPATPGNASADGITASVVRVIGAAPGNAAADGTTAAVTRTIATTPGDAAADGVTATVTNSGTTTISCTPGNAVSDGSLAAITRTIASAPGNAVANGAIAALLRVIATTPGNAVADGVTAAVQSSVTISCTPGNAVADGVAATVTAAVSQLDLILKILVNRQELNPATGTFTLYDDDATTVLYTTNAWADAAGTVPYSGGALRRIDALI